MLRLVILVTLLLTLATPAAAQFQPGGPLNPMECRPTWGGGTECSSRMPYGNPLAPGTPLNPWRGTQDPSGGTRWDTPMPPPGNPLQPGSPLNPIRCRETWGGRVECSSGF